MLAVVEQEQQLAVPQTIEQRGQDRAARLLAHAQREATVVRYQRGVGQRREFDQPDAIRKLLELIARGHQRQACLAAPPEPVSVSRRVVASRRLIAAISLLTPDETGRRQWKVVGYGVHQP